MRQDLLALRCGCRVHRNAAFTFSTSSRGGRGRANQAFWPCKGRVRGLESLTLRGRLGRICGRPIWRWPFACPASPWTRVAHHDRYLGVIRTLQAADFELRDARSTLQYGARNRPLPISQPGTGSTIRPVPSSKQVANLTRGSPCTPPAAWRERQIAQRLGKTRNAPGLRGGWYFWSLIAAGCGVLGTLSRCGCFGRARGRSRGEYGPPHRVSFRDEIGFGASSPMAEAFGNAKARLYFVPESSGHRRKVRPILRTRCQSVGVRWSITWNCWVNDNRERPRPAAGSGLTARWLGLPENPDTYLRFARLPAPAGSRGSGSLVASVAEFAAPFSRRHTS